MIINAGSQHPTLRRSQDAIFDSLRRWNNEQTPKSELALEHTIAAMDEAHASKSPICAWEAAGNSMISNREVFEFTQQYPDRLVGIGSVDIRWNAAKPLISMRRLSPAWGLIFLVSLGKTFHHP